MKMLIRESGNINDRLGRCFELSAKYVQDNSEWTLVHGVIDNHNGSRLTHAWCEKDGQAYDPVSKLSLPTSALYGLYGVVDYKYNKFEQRMGIPETLKVSYTWEAVIYNLTFYENYGPWNHDILRFKDKIKKPRKK